MATDQKSSDLLPETTQNSVIENELPSYRAVSSLAVFSLVFGVLGLFSIASPYFYLCAILAVVLGLWADRSIQHYSDILTGRSLAQAGVALGLVFGLGIFTVTYVRGMIHSRSAASFARYYADVVKNRSLADILWLEIPPVQRKNVSPAEVIEKMQSTKKKEAMVYEMRTGPVRSLKKRLDASKESELHFIGLEREGTEGMNLVALALFEVHAPAPAEGPDPGNYALAVLKGSTEGGKGYDWWVDEVRYPYKPASLALPEKPVDDGHGHAH